MESGRISQITEIQCRIGQITYSHGDDPKQSRIHDYLCCVQTGMPENKTQAESFCPENEIAHQSITTGLSAAANTTGCVTSVSYILNLIGVAVHRQFRKLTKTKGGFPNENSLLKLLYVGIKNASKKWTMPFPNWNLTLSQLVIYFDGRLDAALDL